jgi:2-succinyl-6-hydroxy-2,4-cyclohexadiene-1-carboxylate synthase
MKINSKNKLLNYRVIGNGHPVLFLHGFLESISMWDYLPLNELNVQVIQIDLPGHGASVCLTNEPPSMQEMAKEVLKVVAELNLEHFSIVGHSMGGYVALEVQAISSNCEKVVLLNSNFWSDSPEKRNDRRRIAQIVQTSKNMFLNEAIPNLFIDPVKCEKTIEDLLTETKELSADGIAYASIAMANRVDFTKKIREGKMNISVIQGEIDRIVPMEKMDIEICADVPYYILPQTGHMSHIENPLGAMAALKEIFENKKRKP